MGQALGRRDFHTYALDRLIAAGKVAFVPRLRDAARYGGPGGLSRGGSHRRGRESGAEARPGEIRQGEARREHSLKVGLALGSGGARGIAHIAYLEVLDQLGIETERDRRLEHRRPRRRPLRGRPERQANAGHRRGHALRDLPRFLDAPSFKEAFGIKGRKIEEWLREILPIRSFEDLPIPLRVVATDFWKGEQIVFSAGDIAQAVRASISIPECSSPTSSTAESSSTAVS